MRPDKQVKIMIIAVVIFMVVIAFLAGMQYQKDQPLFRPDLSGQNISIQIVYYSGDKIVDVTRHTIALDHDSIEFFTNYSYVQEHNITMYYMTPYAINYNYLERGWFTHDK